MLQPGRKYSNGSGYRYGFNGKENDRDITTSDYDFGARIYDGRLGKWLSVDPFASKTPDESPFITFGNNPIVNIDPDGKFKVPIHRAIIEKAIELLGLDWSRKHFKLAGRQQYIDIFYATDDDVHFDNKFTAQDVYKRWESLAKEIQDAKLSDDDGRILKGDIDMSFDENLAKVLHTVQDFYSHTNFVELYIEYYKNTHNGNDPNEAEVPIYDDAIKDDKFKKEYLDTRLKSGGFNLWRWLRGVDKKNTDKRGHTHHDDLNKDDENTPEGKKKHTGVSLHSYARTVATKHTKKIIKEKNEELEKRHKKG